LVRPKTSQLCDKKYELEPWYWVSQVEVEERLRAKGWIHGWLMGWRDTGRSTDERTVIATVFPRRAVSNKLPLILPSAECNPALVGCLLANFSTLSFDFVARAKIGGTTINFFYVKQFPILAPASYTEEGIDFIIPRVLELNFTSEHMQSFAEYLGYNGSPFTWDPDCRALLRSELDAYYAYLYGLTRDELRYILDPADIMGPNYPSETFRVLKENELAQFREYRTQRLVLQAWDRLQMDGLLNSRPSSVRPY
jgi:hypothetical protein